MESSIGLAASKASPLRDLEREYRSSDQIAQPVETAHRSCYGREVSPGDRSTDSIITAPIAEHRTIAVSSDQSTPVDNEAERRSRRYSVRMSVRFYVWILRCVLLQSLLDPTVLVRFIPDLSTSGE